MPSIPWVMEIIEDELETATRKFGSFASAHEGYAIIREEVDELWDEIKSDKLPYSRERQLTEAKQVAAMAARYILDLTQEG